MLEGTPSAPSAGETSEAMSATVRADAGAAAKGAASAGSGEIRAPPTATALLEAEMPADEEELDEPAEKGTGRSPP